MTDFCQDKLKKVNEWMVTGGPPYLTDDDLIEGIQHLKYCADILNKFEHYRATSNHIYRDLYSLELIARSRDLM